MAEGRLGACEPVADLLALVQDPARGGGQAGEQPNQLDGRRQQLLAGGIKAVVMEHHYTLGEVHPEPGCTRISGQGLVTSRGVV